MDPPWTHIDPATLIEGVSSNPSARRDRNALAAKVAQVASQAVCLDLCLIQGPSSGFDRPYGDSFEERGLHYEAISAWVMGKCWSTYMHPLTSLPTRGDQSRSTADKERMGVE